ncbi:MAG: hypothetical protein KAX39_00175 [candidate division Zixibacteria bacterium]|nr:hypothetical protein [candidate division Zixibacteria bacterium]
MRKFFCATLLSLLLIPQLGAQEVDIFGYFEPQFTLIYLDGNYYQLQSNKLRVDLKSNPVENVEFGANFDWIVYHGKRDWNFWDFIPKEVTSSVHPFRRYRYQFTYEDRNFLDNAYLRFSFPSFDLMVGKQQISLGTGYAFNPTDVFNFKDLMDPTYEQPGHNALRIDWPLKDGFSLLALYSPESSWQNSGKLLRLKGRWGHFDFSVIGTETEWTVTDYTYPYYNFITTHQRRMLGGDFAGELLGLGIWAEGAYNFVEESKDFWELVVGSDYTFDSELYLMLELYHHSLAKSDYRQYDLNDWLRFFYQEQKSITRDQLYCFVQYPATDLLKIGGSALVSLSDGSIAFVPTALYSFSENVELTLIGNINVGKEGKAYGNNQGHSLLLRSRVYF